MKNSALTALATVLLLAGLFAMCEQAVFGFGVAGGASSHLSEDPNDPNEPSAEPESESFNSVQIHLAEDPNEPVEPEPERI